MAAFGSQSSAPLIIATGEPVMTIGGFNGADPAPTLAQFQQLVADGQVRYVLVGGAGAVVQVRAVPVAAVPAARHPSAAG